MAVNTSMVNALRKLLLIGTVSLMLFSSCVEQRTITIAKDGITRVESRVTYEDSIQTILEQVNTFQGVSEVHLDTTTYLLSYQLSHYTEIGAALIGYPNVFEFTTSGDTTTCSILPNDIELKYNLVIVINTEARIRSYVKLTKRGIKHNKRRRRVELWVAPGKLRRSAKQEVLSFVLQPAQP